MHTHTLYSSVAPGDYGNLTNFHLGPFNNSVRQLSFDVSIMDDNTTEDAEMFCSSLTVDTAELVGIVTVLPDVATATILDNDGKLLKTTQRLKYHNAIMFCVWETRKWNVVQV